MLREDLKKMPFWELAHGKMAQDVQEIFERAQKTALSRGLPCKVKLVIEVRPPDPNDPYYGNIRYQTDFSEPAFTSKQYQTVLHDGMIVKNPQQPAPQLDLLFTKAEPAFPEDEAETLDVEILEEEETINE